MCDPVSGTMAALGVAQSAASYSSGVKGAKAQESYSRQLSIYNTTDDTATSSSIRSSSRTGRRTTIRRTQLWLRTTPTASMELCWKR